MDSVSAIDRGGERWIRTSGEKLSSRNHDALVRVHLDLLLARRRRRRASSRGSVGSLDGCDTGVGVNRRGGGRLDLSDRLFFFRDGASDGLGEGDVLEMSAGEELSLELDRSCTKHLVSLIVGYEDECELTLGTMASVSPE